jgi:F-type H+-transporting ATPase subunit alpha
VAILTASTRGYLDKVPVNKVKDFEKNFLELMRTQHKGILNNFKAGKLDDADLETLKKVALDLAGSF